MSSKILVVGASETDHSFIKNALSEYCVLTVHSSTEAMEKIDIHPDIALVVLNVNLSNIDEYQLLVSLANAPRLKKKYIIVLADHKEIKNKPELLGPAAVEFIFRPVQAEYFKGRTEFYLELYKQELYKRELTESILIYDTVFQQAPIGISISYANEPMLDDFGDFIIINLMFEQITGRSKEELIRLGWEKITHPDDLEEDLRNFKKLKSGEIRSYSIEKRYIRPDGSIVWVHMIVSSFALAHHQNFSHICLVQDITKRKEMEKALIESERSKSVLLSHLPGLAYRCKYDRDWTMQYVSAGCFELTGYTAESLLHNRDLCFNDLIVPEYHDVLWKEWELILAKREPFRHEYEIITAKGELKWVLELGEGVYNEQGEVEALEGIILDISDRKQIENDLRYSNEHDALTGLYNRRYLENLLRNDARMRTTKKRAVVSINLSAIQLLSMTYGFHYSQELIRKTANALKMHSSDNRLLFSSYENQFVFYVKDYKDKNDLTEFCEIVSDTLEALLAIERISGGIGVVEIDDYNKYDVEQLLKNLLIASEKSININDRDFEYCFFDSDMETQITRESWIKHELSQVASGSDDSMLFLQFQPVLDLGSNKICAFEALARLQSNKLGLVPPLEFIPIAEKTKLIITLGEKIFLKAFHFLKKLNENGYDKIGVSVNVSAIQLLRNGFVKNLFDNINEMQVDPENITIEITESIFASNYQEINSVLGALKERGIKIAIDDFGTGYSSLARERELNVTCLKIDKYFIDKLLMLKPEEAITGDIISMAHKLGHFVVAEGIEHEKQYQYLRDYGCDMIQGYLISRPVDEDAAISC